MTTVWRIRGKNIRIVLCYSRPLCTTNCPRWYAHRFTSAVDGCFRFRSKFCVFLRLFLNLFLIFFAVPSIDSLGLVLLNIFFVIILVWLLARLVGLSGKTRHRHDLLLRRIRDLHSLTVNFLRWSNHITFQMMSTNPFNRLSRYSVKVTTFGASVYKYWLILAIYNCIMSLSPTVYICISFLLLFCSFFRICIICLQSCVLNNCYYYSYNSTQTHSFNQYAQLEAAKFYLFSERVSYGQVTKSLNQDNR